MNLNISIATIMQGEAQDRIKCVAFELFFNNKTSCYKEAYKVLSSDNVGNKIRMELLAVSKALEKCTALTTLDISNINVFVEEDDTIDLLGYVNKSKSTLPLNDTKLLNKIKLSSDLLSNKGCSINYKKRTYIDSTYRFANNLISSGECSKADNNLDQAIKLLTPKIISPNDIINKKTNEVASTSIDFSNGLTDLNDKLNQIFTQINVATSEIEELKSTIITLKSYKESLSTLNSEIKIENLLLDGDIDNMRQALASLDIDLSNNTSQYQINQNDLSELENKYIKTKKVIESKRLSDMATIDYLKKEIAKIIELRKIISVTL